MRKKCLLILVLCVSLLMSACQLIPVEESLPPVPVIHPYEQSEFKLATVMRGDMSLDLTIRCVYDLARLEKLSFPVEAPIEDVFVQQGQTVKAGDLLATLDQKTLLQQMENYENNRNTYHRNKRHLQEMLNLELDSCNALIAKLQAELALTQNESTAKTLQQQIASLQQRCETAQKNYENKVRPIDEALYILDLRVEELKPLIAERNLYAGIDGVVTYLLNIEPGEYYQKNKQFITISDINSAVFTTTGDNAEHLPVGSAVTIVTKGKELAAHVIDPTELGALQQDTKKIYIRLDQPDPTINRNESGVITIVQDSRTDVLYVDKSVIHYYDGKSFVYLPAENGLRTMRYVTLGLELRNIVEITDGLEEGEQVVIG